MDFSKGIPEAGKLLISEPFMIDPNFNHTVVLLTRHDNEGSLGFVLNNQSQFNIDEVVDDFPPFESTVCLGGPVGVNSLFYLHTVGDLLPDSMEVIPGLYWGGDFEVLKTLAKRGDIKKDQIIFMVGYSGWEAGQLDQEIKDESWIVTNTSSEEVMSKSGKKMWAEVLKRLGKDYKIMANFPSDPSLN